MSETEDPRVAIVRALNTPPYDDVAGVYATPLSVAARLLAAHRAFVLRETADRLAADAEQGRKEGFTRIYQRAAATKVRGWADEAQQPDAAPHSCSNCGGVDPDTCFTNPDRPPDQCSESEFDGYGQQCQKPAGHNLCTFEEEATDAGV